MYYLIKANLYFVTLSVKQESLGCGVVRVGRITDSNTICSAVALGLAVRVSELSITEGSQRRLSLFSALVVST